MSADIKPIDRKIHIPDCISGFCGKCGKVAKIYGKYCDEIEENKTNNDLVGMWIQENLLRAKRDYKRVETAYNALKNRKTQYAKGMRRLLEIKEKVVELWKLENDRER